MEINALFPNLAADVAQFPVRPGEDPWTYEEAVAQGQALLADRERLLGELAAAGHDLDDLLHNSGFGAGDDSVDSGSSALEREAELSVVNNLRHLLDQTELAISRLRDGTYATCEESGAPIGKARLQAFPRATESVEAR
ncbi:MAG: TraR/DksA family transcriptional regulator, partial [Promicromonosporaceae bacterium]|nr:TraR/DksA family transcriptional regulator [Promicromonosporaceae bacterium]